MNRMSEESELILEKWYLDFYREKAYTGAMQLYMRWIHRQLEKSKLTKNRARILEIGAGEGQHLIFVIDELKGVEEYFLTDIAMSDISIAKIAKDIHSDFRIVPRKEDAQNLSFPDSYFDRVLTSCTLSHLSDADSALREIRRVSKGGGTVSLYVPCDPGMLHRYIRHFISHIKTKKIITGKMQDVKYIWALEHKNHCLGIQILIREIFKDDFIIQKRYPFPFFSWNFNIFSVYQIRVVKK